MLSDVTAETAADYVQSTKAQGAHYIKLMQEDSCSMAWETGSVPSASMELKRLLLMPRMNTASSYAHATSLENTMHVLRTGVDGLTHSFCDQPPTEELVELYKQTGACQFATIGAERRVIDDITQIIMLGSASLASPAAKLKHARDSVRVLNKRVSTLSWVLTRHSGSRARLWVQANGWSWISTSSTVG